METNAVSIIIVNHNRKDYLAGCLDSCMAQSCGLSETIVIDNASVDGSQEMLKKDYPWVRLIENKENLLYCKPINQGINASSGKYVICLNNDIKLGPEFVAESVSAIKKDNRIGMVCGRGLSKDGKAIDSAGQILGKSRRPIDRGYREIDTGQYRESGYIFGAPGSAVLYRRQMLEDIKSNGEYFDESYGVFYEDLDINWRARRAGWKAFYAAGATARHLRGGTAKNPWHGQDRRMPIKFFRKYDFAWLNDDLKIRLLKNRYATIIKNDSARDFLKFLPFILAYEVKLWGWIIFFRPGLITRFIMSVLRT